MVLEGAPSRRGGISYDSCGMRRSPIVLRINVNEYQPVPLSPASGHEQEWQPWRCKQRKAHEARVNACVVGLASALIHWSIGIAAQHNSAQ